LVNADTTFTVYGVCGMCKERIETTVQNLAGVGHAHYNVEAQQLNIVFSSAQISVDVIKQELANVGHDTDTHKAKKSSYNKLHSCCKYERP